MKCEKCGNELLGGTIICRACHHNNALRGVSEWRARKTGELNPAPLRRPESPTAAPAPKQTLMPPPRIVPRKDALPAYGTAPEPTTPKQPEPNLLHFPAAAPNAPTATSFTTSSKPSSAVRTEGQDESSAEAEAKFGGGNLPPWRAQLRERVREVRERRSGSLTEPSQPARSAGSHAVALDENPMVQSALNRIRRASYTQPATVAVRTARQAAQAAAALQRPGIKDITRAEAAPQSSALHSSVPHQAAARSTSTPNPENRALGPRNSQPFAPRPTEAATRRIAPRPNASLATETAGRADPNSAAPQPDPTPASMLAPMPSPMGVAPATSRLPRIGDSRTLTPRTHPSHPGAAHTADPGPLTGAPAMGDSGRLPSADSFIVPVTVRRTTGSLRNSGALAGNLVNTTEIIEIPQTPTETPARPASLFTADEARPASLWVRTMAGTCDFEAVAAAYLPLFGLYATLNTSLGDTSFFIMVTLLAVIAFVYQLVMLLYAGRTFGMAMLKLQLVDAGDEERAVTRWQQTLRAGAATVAFLLPPINLIVARLSRNHRSLPDLCSGTTVTAAPPAKPVAH